MIQPLTIVMPAKAGTQYAPILVTCEVQWLLGCPAKPGNDKWWAIGKP